MSNFISRFLYYLKQLLLIFNMPYTLFSWRNIHTYKSTLLWLALSFFIAFFCVLPFYAQWILEEYGIKDTPPLLASLFGLLSIASVLFVPKNRRFSVGFFVGVLWFYWIPLGARYFDMSFIIPIIVIAQALLIGFIFYICLWCECLLLRFAFLMLLSFFTPFGFDWIVFESVFAYSYIGVDKVSFALVILGLWALVKYQSWWRILGIVCLLFSLDWHMITKPISPNIPLKIKLVQSNLEQDFTWRMEHADSIFSQYIDNIMEAIKDGYDVVVLPESAFYRGINTQRFKHLDTLLSLSKQIVIVAGALRVEENKDGGLFYFNSIYKFDNADISFHDKVLLVPFGEYIPSFFTPIVRIFFPDLGGFSPGEEFGYFQIKDIEFKSAICYEGTHKGFYSDNPPYVFVISNNAWFMPSIEPILQKNLMKYYARLHQSIIFHSTNRSPHAIITP